MEVKSKFNFASVVYGSLLLLSVLLVSMTVTNDMSNLENLFLPKAHSQSVNTVPTVLRHKTTKLIVDQNGQKQVFYSQSENLYQAMSDNGFNLTSGLVLDPNRYTALDGGTVQVTVKNPVIPINIVEDNRSYTIQTSQNTVRNILLSCNIHLGSKDMTYPPLDKEVHAGSTIVIDRATPLLITYGKSTYEMETQNRTMGEVVAEAKDELNIPDDEVNQVLLASEDKIKPFQEIAVTKVITEEQREYESIDPSVEYYDDWEMEIGNETTTDYGSAGEKEKIYNVTKENGVETSRELVAENVTREASPIKIAVGKKQPPVPDPVYMAPSAGAAVGTASWYYYGSTPTCANRDYPSGTQLLVTNNATGASVVVTVNDYGPAAWTGRIIDLNSVAFSAIAPLSQGLTEVSVSPL